MSIKRILRSHARSAEDCVTSVTRANSPVPLIPSGSPFIGNLKTNLILTAKQTAMNRNTNAGFTIIELMLTISIAGILLAVAIVARQSG